RLTTTAPNSFWLKNLFLVALEQLGDSLEEIRAYSCFIPIRCYDVQYSNSGDSRRSIALFTQYSNSGDSRRSIALFTSEWFF
ncbi:protein ycf2, partial [Phtheirospermum japonicum]